MKGIKVITQENVSYHFMIHEGKILTINRMEKGIIRKFYFEAEEPKNRITAEFFEMAMEALLRGRPDAFDVVSTITPEPYGEVTVKVYKKVMDEFYNLAIADVAFNRHSSSIDEAINATYTLFDEE